MGGLTLIGATRAADKVAQTYFLRGSGRNGRAVLHSDLRDASSTNPSANGFTSASPLGGRYHVPDLHWPESVNSIADRERL